MAHLASWINRLKKHSCKPGTQQFLRSNKPDAKSATNFSVRTFLFLFTYFSPVVKLNARQNWKFIYGKRNCSVFFSTFLQSERFIRSVCSFVRSCWFEFLCYVRLFRSQTHIHVRCFTSPTAATTQLSAPIFLYFFFSTLVLISFSYTLKL